MRGAESLSDRFSARHTIAPVARLGSPERRIISCPLQRAKEKNFSHYTRSRDSLLKTGFLALAFWMHNGRMLGCLVLRVGMRCVLVQRLGRTMVLCPGKRRPGKHKQKQHGGKQLLHATNLARTTRRRGTSNCPVPRQKPSLPLRALAVSCALRFSGWTMVMVMMVAMMVHPGGKHRTSQHHQKQESSKNLFHSTNLARKPHSWQQQASRVRKQKTALSIHFESMACAARYGHLREQPENGHTRLHRTT